MLSRSLTAALLLPATLWSASLWMSVRDIEGKQQEGQVSIRSLPLESSGKTAQIPFDRILSIHNGAAASPYESERITAGIAAIQGADRKARDAAVEELTAIGIPVITPLLRAYKDTDQHEPRPLYRLFERIMPSYADSFDRSLSLVRLQSGKTLRGAISDFTLDLRAPSGNISVPWSKVRALAVRQKLIHKSMQVHSIRHCTQIEYLDTGIGVTGSTKLDVSARGFVRLSWDTDSWASDANGIQKPGSPAYKTNLVDGHPFGALVGRVGASGDMFFLGVKASKTALPAGRLGLAINDNRHWQNNLGTFYVTVSATDSYDLGDSQ
jgi:hypothetical protein